MEATVLIVPLWNWNLPELITHDPEPSVLIVPLWNWNPLSTGSLTNPPSSFNRTFMELKFDLIHTHCWCGNCFNRTFMELKSHYPSIWCSGKAVLIVPLWNWNPLPYYKSTSLGSFNRTFMELKWNGGDRVPTSWTVLIVPLWNWNDGLADSIPAIA